MSAEQLLESFLETTVDTGKLNTEYKLCPELDEVPVTVKKVEPKAGTYIDRKSGDERMWAMLMVSYEVDSEEARQELKRDSIVVQGKPIFLTVEDGQLDMENNQQLARTLKVFGIDGSEMSLKEIIDSMVGQYAIGKIVHRALTDKSGEAMLDEEGNQRYAAEVSAIGKA